MVCESVNVDTYSISLESPINYIPFARNKKQIENKVTEYDSEGIVAKNVYSKWSAGTRTTHWIKVKNVKVSTFFVLGYDTENGFFHVGVIKDNCSTFVGLFSHGITPEEKDALIQIVKNNQCGVKGSVIFIEPSLCVELSYLELYKNQLRQPRFLRFRFDANWEDCTWESLQKRN
jgi:ATP-dependent DNA ligase